MLTRTLVGARGQLIKIVTDLSNQIRGLMKTFGLIIPKGAGRVFEDNVRRLLASNGMLEQIIVPLVEAWRSIRTRAAELDRQLVAAARTSTPCKLLMSIPGVGAVTAATFTAAIEAPENFRTSRAVGAWLGLTTRRYQSGEVDYDGHISRRGDTYLRVLLYEAARGYPDPNPGRQRTSQMGPEVEGEDRLQAGGDCRGEKTRRHHAHDAEDWSAL